MMPRADQGVVDGRLNVYGVINLKVADLSIAPKNVGTVGAQLPRGLTASNRLPEHIFDVPPHWGEGCDDHC